MCLVTGDLEPLCAASLLALRELNLAGNRIESLDAVVGAPRTSSPLDSLSRLPDLRRLHLARNPVAAVASYRESLMGGLLPRLVSLDGLDAEGNEEVYEDSDQEESDGEEEAEEEAEARNAELEFMQGCFWQYSAAAAAADDARALALAMSAHPRLGAASPARVLTADLWRRVLALTRLLHTRWPAAIHVRTGTLVDRVLIRYSDGSARECGGLGGAWQPPFLLQPGELLCKLGMKAGDALDSIQFTTTRGRTSPVYGGPGGSPWGPTYAPQDTEGRAGARHPERPKTAFARFHEACQAAAHRAGLGDTATATATATTATTATATAATATTATTDALDLISELERSGVSGGLPGAVELQRRWHALSAAEREGYEAEARADKARFDREMLAHTPAFASLAMFRCSDGWLNEVYPLAACPHRPDTETLRDVRLLFSEVFKELHAEVPPLDAHCDPPLLLAGAVRTEGDEEFYDELDFYDEMDEMDEYDDFDSDGGEWGDDDELDDDGEMFW